MDNRGKIVKPDKLIIGRYLFLFLGWTMHCVLKQIIVFHIAGLLSAGRFVYLYKRLRKEYSEEFEKPGLRDKFILHIKL